MTIPALVVFGVLLAISLLAAGHPLPAVLLCAAGLLGGVGLSMRSARRGRLLSVAAAPPAEAALDATPPAAGQPPPAAEDEQPSDDVFPLRKCPPATEQAPPSAQRRFIVFAVSLSVYVAIAAASLPDLTTTFIVLTLLLHEAGHFAAMYFLGYSDLSMFFIPFVAGAVTGRKSGESPSDQLLMLLAGPAPGLLAGCLIYWLGGVQPGPSLRALALWLVALNFLNLLPVWPLDGGRICWLLFSRHSAIAQAALSACSLVGACFLFLAPQGGTTFLLVMAVLLLVWIPPRYRQARASLAFSAQYPAAPAELERLSERQLLDLYRLAAPPKPDTNDRRAVEMRLVYQRVAPLPRTTPPFRYLLLYLVLWALALTTAAGTDLQGDVRKVSRAVGTLFDSLMPG